MQRPPRWTCAAALLLTACVRSAPLGEHEERESELPAAECAELRPEAAVPRLPDGGLDTVAAADAGLGWMDMGRIRTVVRSHLRDVRDCRDQHAAAYAGRLAARFVIAHSGQVCAARIAEATPREAALEQCVADAVRAWRFPAPKGTGPVTVTYPFDFTAPGPVVPLEFDDCSQASGTGDGGVDGGAAPDAPAGSLPKEEIRRVIRANIAEVRECYESALERWEDVAGKVDLRFVIAGEGRVCAARVSESTVSDVAMGNCIVRAAQRWRFPPVDGVVIVTYPFVFRPRPEGTRADAGSAP